MLRRMAHKKVASGFRKILGPLFTSFRKHIKDLDRFLKALDQEILVWTGWRGLPDWKVTNLSVTKTSEGEALQGDETFQQTLSDPSEFDWEEWNYPSEVEIDIKLEIPFKDLAKILASNFRSTISNAKGFETAVLKEGKDFFSIFAKALVEGLNWEFKSEPDPFLYDCCWDDISGKLEDMVDVSTGVDLSDAAENARLVSPFAFKVSGSKLVFFATIKVDVVPK